MNPRHLALVFVVAWMGCSRNEAIDASSTPVDAFDASTFDANTDVNTFDANTDVNTLDAGAFVEADANADAPLDEDAQPAREVGPGDAWVVTVPDANTTDANVIDANVIDANVIDANVTDANVTDANVIDANVTDANVSNDASTNDANFDCGVMTEPLRAAACAAEI